MSAQASAGGRAPSHTHYRRFDRTDRLLHGFLMLVSLIGSIFGDFRIYAFPNSGFWYDVGFVIGASSFLGGGAHGVRRRRRSD